jgi:hypothetical protein
MLGLFLINLVSCTEIDLTNISKDVNVQETLVLPIGEANITLGDLLSNVGSQDNVTFDSDSILLQVNDSNDIEAPTYDFQSNFNPTDLTFSPFPTNRVLNPPYTFPAIGTTSSINTGLNTDITKQRVDSIRLKTMSFSISLNSNMLTADNYRFIVTFPGDRLKYQNGNSITIDAKPLFFNVPVNITLYNVVMYTTGTSAVLPIKADILVTPGNSSISVGPTSTIALKIDVKSLDFDVAFGLFDLQKVGAQPLEIPFDLKSSFASSMPNLSLGLKLANPKIDLQLISNIGTYLKFNIENIKAYVKENPTVQVEANFNGSSTPPSETISRPEFNKFVTYNFKQLNRVWGGTNLLFDLTKNYNMLSYKFTLQNDLDMINAHPDKPCFVKADTKIKTKFKVTIPLYFDKGTSITLIDTISDLGSKIKSNLKDNTVDSAALILTVKNGIPLKLKFEITHFLDSLGNELPVSGFERTYSIEAPEVNSIGLSSYGSVNNIAESHITLNILKNQVEEFKKLKNLIFKLTVEGKDANSAIQITKNNTLSVKAGLFVKGTASFNLGTLKN